MIKISMQTQAEDDAAAALLDQIERELEGCQDAEEA
jgi:hypothetical protein